MFNVELNDEGVELATELFGVTPVLVYSRWANYMGTCVWRCNQYSTYSLPGEPLDEKYLGVFADGRFTDGFNEKTQSLDGPVRRMWGLLEQRSPESYAKRSAAHKRATEWDQETMWQHAAIIMGSKAKKDAKGEWSIEEEKPRKRFLGLF